MADKIDIKNKADLIEAARLALVIEDEQVFWADVAQELDRIEAKPDVKPRLTGASS